MVSSAHSLTNCPHRCTAGRHSSVFQRVFVVMVWVVSWRLAAGQSAHGQSEPEPELVQMVLGLLQESDEGMRSLAFEQIRTEMPGPAATREFAAQLAKVPSPVQVGLLRALADRGDGEAREQLLVLLDNPSDAAVKLAAIEALGKLGTPDDVPRLVDVIKSGTAAEQEAARASLTKLPGDTVPTRIATYLETEAQSSRLALMQVLTDRRGLPAIPALLKGAVDPDPAIRQGAMVALGELASVEHLPGMLHGVLRAEKGPERVAAEKGILAVCQRVDAVEERAIPILKFMESRSAADQTTLLSTLGRVGGTKGLARIEQAIRSKDGTQHGAGILALANWPDASVTQRVKELTTKDPHPGHRTTMLRALIRIAAITDDRAETERLALLKEGMQLAGDRLKEKLLAVEKARAIRHIETLRFLVGTLDDPELSEKACESIVELAHHRSLRHPHEPEFHAALDQVLAKSKDPIVIDRAQRYKANQTWVRPKE